MTTLSLKQRVDYLSAFGLNVDIVPNEKIAQDIVF
jgi:hypothetical protein